MDPHARLRAFIADTSRNATGLATELGVSRPMASQLLSGSRRPGLDLAVAIEALTSTWRRGPLRAAEWTSRRRPRAQAPNERPRRAAAA